VSIVGEIGGAWDDDDVEHAAQVCGISEYDAAEMLDRLQTVRYWINAVAVKHAVRVGMEAHCETAESYHDTWKRAYDEATKVLVDHLLQIAEADSVEDAAKEIWAQYEP